MTYNFSATQNNGRIVSSADAVTGENVSYTYDSLNRLIAAATTNRTGPIWGNSYSYDGFGNLTGKTVTQGSAPSALPQVNSATNQARMIGDYGFDANGNWLGTGSQSNAWNVENQLISNGMVDYGGNPLTYTYDPWGKRVMQYSVGGATGPTGTIYFYSIAGQRLATYTGQYPNALTQTAVNMYFGGRLLAPVDRLGSVRQNGSSPIAYFPWGEERTSTPDGFDKFATYFRDATNNGIGEDYASARYYNNNFGRFWSPDPLGAAAADRTNPVTWNRYTYVIDDPVNHQDRQGLFYATCELLGNCGSDSGGGEAGGEPDDDSDIDICLLYTYYPGCGAKSPAPPSSQDEWDNLSLNCKKGLMNAMPGASTSAMDLVLNKATAAESTLETATGSTSVDWTMLAAIGIYETGWVARNENDGAGVGVGIFQITNGGAAAMQLSSALQTAVQMLGSNLAQISQALPSLSPGLLTQALADSWNAGAQGVINRINAGESPDYHTSPIFSNGVVVGYRGGGSGQYGSDILKLMDCF